MKDWNEQFKEERLRRAERRRVELEAAKREASTTGKELYDFRRLDRLYTRVPLCPGFSTSSSEEWEYSYYVVYKDLRTLEEFAKVLEMNDLYDGGDMHLDQD